MHGVGGRGVDGVEGEDGGEEDERDHPGVFEGIAFELLQEGAGLAPFRGMLLAISLILSLAEERSARFFPFALSSAPGRGGGYNPHLHVYISAHA